MEEKYLFFLRRNLLSTNTLLVDNFIKRHQTSDFINKLMTNDWPKTLYTTAHLFLPTLGVI